MSYRLLLDENVERSVATRLADDGHDVERVADVPELGKGTSDEQIAAYADENGRVLLTYDDDFVTTEFGTPVCYVPDETVPGPELTAILRALDDHYPQSELDGVVYLSTDWL
jgi:predicted nuclease of predicted toxin-antitoxin system